MTEQVQSIIIILYTAWYYPKAVAGPDKNPTHSLGPFITTHHQPSLLTCKPLADLLRHTLLEKKHYSLWNNPGKLEWIFKHGNFLKYAKKLYLNFSVLSAVCFLTVQRSVIVFFNKNNCIYIIAQRKQCCIIDEECANMSINIVYGLYSLFFLLDGVKFNP